MRIRTVKFEFWTNESLSEISAEAALLAIGLLNYADDEGYFKANRKLIEAAIFPLRELSVSIQELLTELSVIGYIQLIEGSDKRQYGLIVNFTEHQKVNRPSKSKIKKLLQLTESSLNTHGGLTEDSLGEGKGKDQGSGIRDQGREGKGNSTSPHDDDPEITLAVKRIDPDDAKVQQVYGYHQKRSHEKNQFSNLNLHIPRFLDAETEAAVKARLAEGYSVQDLCEAIDGCLQTPHNIGTGKNSTGETFTQLELICRSGPHVNRFISNSKRVLEVTRGPTVDNLRGYTPAPQYDDNEPTDLGFMEGCG